jgi:hypothetical protein
VGCAILISTQFALTRRLYAMGGLALASFLGLYAYGSNMLGWSDPRGQVQLGLFLAFIFGIICGYRVRE